MPEAEPASQPSSSTVNGISAVNGISSESGVNGISTSLNGTTTVDENGSENKNGLVKNDKISDPDVNGNFNSVKKDSEVKVNGVNPMEASVDLKTVKEELAKVTRPTSESTDKPKLNGVEKIDGPIPNGTVPPVNGTNNTPEAPNCNGVSQNKSPTEEREISTKKSSESPEKSITSTSEVTPTRSTPRRCLSPVNHVSQPVEKVNGTAVQPPTVPRTPTFPELLPGILSSLSHKFNGVECQLNICPNLSVPPFNLSFSTIGTNLQLIPDDRNTKISENDGNLLGIYQGYRVLSNTTPANGMRITLRNNSTSNSNNWKPILKEVMAKKFTEPWEIFCLEVVNDITQVHLLNHGTPTGRPFNIGHIWLFPVGQIIQDKGPKVEENGEMVEEKKKVVRKVKSTNPDGTPRKRIVKKKVVKKTEAKDTNEVVQEVAEDPASVNYVIKLGQVPAADGISLAEEKGKNIEERSQNCNEIAQNGVEKAPNGLQNERNNIEINGIKPINSDIQSTTSNTPFTSLEPSSTSKSPNESCKNDVVLDRNGSNTPETQITQNGVNNISESSSINGVNTNITKKFNDVTESSNNAENNRDSTDKFSVAYGESSKINNDFKFSSSIDLPLTTLNNILSTSKFDQSSRLETGHQNGIEMSRRTSSQQVIRNDECRTNGHHFERKCSLDPILEETALERTVSHLEKVLNTSSLAEKLPKERPMPSTTTFPLTRPNVISPTLSMADPLSSATTITSELSTFKNGNRFSAEPESDLSVADDLSFASTLTMSEAPKIKVERAKSTPNRENEIKVRGMSNVPVFALQLVLSTISYKELARLRRVHPHWDELCGQLLNSGYFELIHKADILMQECQRRVINDGKFQRPLQVLTNLQVHVLNPVDMLRAAMDEGVLCFPYGQILDSSFSLLDKIEEVMNLCEDDGDLIPLNWEKISILSKRASLHYRRFVEPEVEKRMSEVCKLSAQQRLQRLDSFLVESTVSKLEQRQIENRDELHWEMEQLKEQNKALKKDNREMKKTCATLEGRIDALERKFKTMARLLQS